jgi:hypothetical protein
LAPSRSSGLSIETFLDYARHDDKSETDDCSGTKFALLGNFSYCASNWLVGRGVDRSQCLGVLTSLFGVSVSTRTVIAASFMVGRTVRPSAIAQAQFDYSSFYGRRERLISRRTYPHSLPPLLQWLLVFTPSIPMEKRR